MDLLLKKLFVFSAHTFYFRLSRRYFFEIFKTLTTVEKLPLKQQFIRLLRHTERKL